MLIFLPPSESKAAVPESGEPVSLEKLAFPELNDDRRIVAQALADVSARPEALQMLGVGASLESEVARNMDWDTSPALRVDELYTGVLYDALDFGNLTASQQERARDVLWVFSGLWGVLTFRDAVAPYRMSMDADVGMGRMATWWKDRLTPVINEAVADEVVVDLRSSSYANAYVQRDQLAANTVAVGAVHEKRVAGAVQRKVISHMAKQTRGLVARWLLTSTQLPRSVEEVAVICRKAAPKNWDVELSPPVKAHQKWTLTVVQRD